MIAAITGHRPEKIDDPQWVKDALMVAYDLFNVSKVVVGMAAGVDLWAAKVAYDAGIPFIAARPWAGHRPRKADWQMYESTLHHAEEVVDVDPSLTYPGVWVYQKRNKWMVDHSDFIISVWDGSDGGTRNCVEYGAKIGVRIFNCNPKKRICDFLIDASAV